MTASGALRSLLPSIARVMDITVCRPSDGRHSLDRRLAALIDINEAQQMCTGDAFRLCSSEIPNIPRITACMIKARAQLSSGCRAVMDRDLREARKVAAQ